MDEAEANALRKFRESVAGEGPREDIRIVYHVSGGMPEERVEETFEVHRNKQVDVARRSTLTTDMPQEASARLEADKLHDLMQLIAAGLDSLVTRSEARFLPDSTIGTLTVEAGGEEVTLYFLADEDDRQAQDMPIAPEMRQALQQISDMSKRLLEEDEANNG